MRKKQSNISDPTPRSWIWPVKSESRETIRSSTESNSRPAIRPTREIDSLGSIRSDMSTEEGTETPPPLDEVMEDIRREPVRRVAAEDRYADRDGYDVLEDE